MEKLRTKELQVKDKVRNFSSILYRDSTSRLEVVERELADFLAEALVMPTMRRVRFQNGEFLEEETGEKYLSLLDKAIGSVSGGDVKTRFEAEKQGFVRASKIVEYYLENYGFAPPFVVASPPGEVYRGEEGRAKSSTFLYMPEEASKGKEVLYKRYSVFTDEIEVDEHIKLLEKVGSVSESMFILSEMVELDNAEAVVALPVVLEELSGSIDDLAAGLGFEGWGDIEQKTKIHEKYSSLDTDTKERRGMFVEYFSEKIRELVFMDEEAQKYEELDEIMRLVFASERGGFFVEQGFSGVDEVRRYIDSLFHGGRESESINGNSQEFDIGWVNMSSAYDYTDLSLLRLWVMSTELARDSYIGTACGMGGSADVVGLEVGYEMVDTGQFQFQDQSSYVGGAGEYESGGGHSDKGEKQCYKCPVCVDPKGDVYKKDGYLVCSKNPQSHKIRATG